MDEVTLDMGETATYARRELTWYPTGPKEGLLVIRLWEWARRRRGPQTGRLGYEADVYQVMEIDPPPFVLARAFGFLNRTDAAQELPYKVLVGRETSCSCKAGRCRTETDKHVDAMRLLLETRVFDGLDDAAPADFVERPDEATNYEPTGVR